MKNIINIYSLSPLQEGMLFHSLYDEDDENSQSYFSQMKLRLNGKLDIAMFEKAWKEVIKRHDILRTKFLFGKTEKNVQVVYRTVPFNVDYTDWRSFSREEQESKIEEFLRLDKQRGFDWDDVPLMRVMLIHNDIDEYTMVWSHHHILLDGWSVSLVVKELFHIYNALCQEATITLPPAQQYGKYIHWLRSRSKDSQNTKEFWATKLKGFTEPTQFNLAAPMKGFDQQGYEEYWWHLSKDLTHSLNHIVKEHKITLNTIIQSAWALLLSYYSGTKDVLFGATSSGRPADLPGVENMVGLFISTLPVRAQIPDDEVLLEWMKNFQSQLMEIRQYEYSSLVDIQGVSEVPRGTPLFESLFVFENYPVGEMESITDLRIEEIQGKEQANYPFVLSAGPGEQIPFKIMFDRSKFDEDTIHRISGQLTYVLDQIAKNPNVTISSIQFLTEKETKQILVDWNDTAGEYPREKTIHELFEEQVSLKPDGIALETEDGAVTYRELNESANQIAHYLIEQGIEIGDPIGICMNRSLEEIASMLGILKVGGAYVGLDPEYPEERLKHIVEETEMPLLLTTSQSGLDEAAYDVDIVNIDLLDLPEEKTNIFREGISATALSNIIYTSGSTGKPKGVCVPHRGVVRLVKGETYVPITSDDVFLHVASISFDATTLEVWSSLLNGARLVLLPTRNASLQDYENVIQKYNVSILWLTAGLFNVFVDHNLQALKGVKYILIGGETVSVPHVRKAMEALEGTEIINGYGPSENTVFTTCHRIEEADLERPSIPIGRPIANTEVYVLDENQQPVPVGVIGELYAGGDGLAIGYMNRPELTAERFIPHPFKQGSGEKLYRTGDLVRYLPDGKIEFIGRADHQVKIRGFRIELGEIEVVLKQYPDVRDAVVTVVEDELGDKRLSAYIVTDQSLDVKKIKNHLKEKLPNYMIPDFVTLLAELPLTRNGKVDRAALPAPEIVEGEEYIAPRTPTEEIVSGIWSGVLGVEKVGSNDSFFDLGGHSLLATTTVSKLQNAFGVEVTIKDLFENPTVEQLANHLDQMLSGENKIDFPEIEIIDKEKFIPLSYAQQRLWFISQLTSQSSIYNIPWALKLNGKLQVDALEKSINDMVVRHESLRTIIKEENGQARQIVVPPRDSKLEINDLSNMEEIIRLKEVERITEEEATKDFDLSVGPLFQVKLLKLSDNEHIFLCTMHHIISDAWSMGIFLEELFELYRSYCSGTEAKLPPLNYQYTDFSVWQRKWLNNEVLENQLKYWKNELSGKLPVLQLPSDYPRPAQQTFNGALLTERVPTELVHKLRKLSKQEGTTLFMTVLAAYQGFLSRYTNQDDIIVGSPIANRNHASIEGIIGFFVNSLVIRTNVSTEMTFTDLMSKVKEKALNAYLNQDIPFERIVDEVVEERSLSYSPIFQTMLVFQNKASKIPKGLNIDLEPISVQLPFAKFDLTVIIEEEDDEFTLAFEYNTDLFKEGTIKRLSRNFLHWLESVVVNPKEKLTNLPLTAQEEEHQLLIEWNKTEKAFLEHQSIPEWFEAKVQETPDAIAVVFNDNSLTYKQLNDRANRLAHFLLEKGIDPEEPVGICLGKSLEMIIAILGVLKSGAAYVPLDPEYPSERLEYMLNDAQISHVITGKEYSSKLNDYTSQIYITGQNDVLKDYSKENPNVITSPDQLAYIIYTSGSTGNPKGVMIEHRGVTNLATQQIDFQKITAESRVIQFASFSFDASVFEIFSTFMAGASLYIGEKEEILPGPDLTGFLNKHKITHATLPPTALVWLEEKELPYLEVIVSAGSACTLELAREWSKNKTFINGYGPTETTVCATYFQCDPSLDLPSVPIGRPVPNTEVYILDQNLQPVPTGVVGELYIGGKGLARGYINNTKLTKESFISHTFRNGKRIRLYKTGDLVRYLPDGNIEYIGRKDHQVKIRGFRVELGEVESILAKYPGVKDVVVTARKDYKYKEARLVAYLVTDEQLDERAVRRYVKEHLPTFMVPSDIVKLDEFPLTPNGKVDLNKLPEPEGQADDKNYAAPTNEVEEILVSIWENVLNKRKIGINDNFFELGGDSILSIQIIAQAKQKGLSLTAKQLFEHQTIAELAQVAKRVTGISAQQDAVIGGFPLTPIQSWFFEKNSDNPHHWNQSMALKVEEPLDRELLEKCFQIIQQHHDILRLRFNRNSSGEWKPYISGPDQTVPLTVYDITNIPEDQLEDFVMEKENETQSSLNLLEGPVWKAVYFKHETQTGRLFWVIHHLAVDGVSWRILMEDVNDIYLQLQDGKEVKLPLKTSSYKEWAHKLLDYAVSPAIQSSKDYWLTANENETLTTIPIDFPSGNNTEKYTDKVTVSLSEEETELLFQEFLHSYRINVEEVLLTSLVHSIAEWTGSDQLVVNIEGHGREEILENLDLTRTVGWFTSLFPVKLKKGKDIRNTLRDIKETIRSMPNKGVDYGILRYLNKETSDILKNNIQPSISFNYLGQFNNDNKGDSIFTTSEELSNNQDVNMERFHLIDVVSLISDNKLQLTLLFSNDMYKKSTMTNIANSLRRHLLQLLESKSGEFQMYTPSDFPLCKLSQEKIDELIGSRTDVEVMYPLSPLQKGMLFHTYLNHGQGEYISQLGLVLNGELHKEIFKNAWEQVINQHLVLRTAFKREKEGEILQLVYKNVSVSFSYKDWSHLSEEEQSRKYEKLEDIERKKEFNLEEPPLMRILLIKVGPEKHRVLWTHHHVILDGWSIPLVLKDVFAYYEADLKGYRYRPHKISSFEQYIAWLGKKETHQSEQYWREQLKGVKSPTLLLSNSSNGLEAGDHQQINWYLSKDLSETLQRLTHEYKITLNILLHGAWALLLSKYSGENDIIYGTTSAGRPPELPDVESMIGLFINTLPVRSEVKKDEKIINWLKELQSQHLEMRQHEYISLVDIQGVSEVPRGTPLFESLFVFENYPVGEMESITDLRIEEIQGKEQANYPFVLSAGPGEQIPFKIMFDRSKFDEDTIHRISGQLTYVLDQIAKNPNATISSIQFLTEKETKQILVDWNDTAGEYPREKTIHELFEEQVSLKPDGIALETEDGAVTYRELNESANQIAHYLIEQGIEIGDPIGICMNRSLEEIASMLGILKVGGAYVGLDPEYPEERLKHIVEETEMPLLLTTSQSGLDEAAYDVDIVNIDLLDLPEEKTNIFREGISATALSNIIYTSGSTGKPKGVCVPHRGVVRLVKGETYVPITSDDVFLHVASISFDATTLEVWSSLLNGARLVLLPTRNASLQDYENVIQKHNVSILWLTAGLFNVFVDHNLQALKGVKYLLIGGETVSVPHVRKAMEALEGTEIINGYGPSENTVFTTCHRIEEADLERPSIPIGRPIANTEVYVLDENQQPVPVGVIGELYAGGDGLAIGYMNRPELTAERFIPHPFKQGSGEKLYRTGDLVRYLPDGKIEFIGRADHQVKIRGFRIELGEIEVVLKQYPDVRDAVVTTFEDGTGDKKLIAYLITDGVVEDREIREYTQGRLPNYMIPWKFMFLSEFPLTKNGKVDRKSLPIPFDRPSESYVEPKTKLERKFVELWERVLGRKNVGTHDNFFELGGHSLLATKLVFVINEELGYNITLRQLFEKPTIVGMIQSLENKTEERSMEEILKKDIFLDKEIDKQIQQAKRVNTRFNSILLTGATGFLGAYMLRDLLNETDATIYCLVRGKGYEDGFNRIKNNLMKYALWDERYKQQIIPLIGDLSQDSLGLSVDTWRELENKIDMIYHTGADVNFMMPYEESKYTNVYGTKEIIRLASSKKIKPIHYVSTLSVFTLSPDGESMLVSEDMEPRVNEGLSIGYTQSKCVAENVITLARNKGLPISIYRPGRISGDSTTGRVNESDLLWRLVRGCIELGKAPEMDGNEVEMTPVDMISKSIICLSVDESTQNGTFHLFNNNKISFESITQEMKSQYASLEVVGIAEWLEALEADARKQSKNAMSPLVHLLKEGILEAEAIQFENSKTMDQLEKYGITYPKPTRKMIKKSIQYFSETGVLQNVEQV